MRRTIVAGNWKMNASKESVNKLILGILSGMSEVSSEVVVCAPFPYLSQIEDLIADNRIKLGAQNLNTNSLGAFTGEVSANMIKDFGVRHVIVGHSERRSLYGETSSLVAEKVSPNAFIIVIICAVIFIKGWLVIDHLMGLKHANPMLRWSVHSYFFIMPPILAVIVIFPEWVAKVTTL